MLFLKDLSGVFGTYNIFWRHSANRKEDPSHQRSSYKLCSFLGLANYYTKFLPNLSNILAPLYHLLQKAIPWKWEATQTKAFEEAKSMLTSSCLLTHYDQNRELTLTCDDSPYGIGAVLAHKMDDGLEKPVAFASRSLAPAEKRYAQLDKEALAIIFGVKKFHQYLAGRSFTIYSDHKPLQHLFSEHKTTPTMASSRIQRWSLTLGAYNYKIAYKPGTDIGNADCLSRLPLPEFPSNVSEPGDTVILMEMLQDTPVTAQDFRKWMDADPVISKVRKLVLQGWQYFDDEKLEPYFWLRDEPSVSDGCILRGCKVIVPKKGRLSYIQVTQGSPGWEVWEEV